MNSYKGGRGGDGGTTGPFQPRPSTTTSHHFLRAQSLLFDRRNGNGNGNERQAAAYGGGGGKNRDAALQRLHQTVSGSDSLTRYVSLGYKSSFVGHSHSHHLRSSSDHHRPDSGTSLKEKKHLFDNSLSLSRPRGRSLESSSSPSPSLSLQHVSQPPYAHATRPLTTTTTTTRPPSPFLDPHHSVANYVGPTSTFGSSASAFDAEEDAVTLVGAESGGASVAGGSEFFGANRGGGGDKRPRSAAILARTHGRAGAGAGAGVVQVVGPAPSHHGPTTQPTTQAGGVSLVPLGSLRLPKLEGQLFTLSSLSGSTALANVANGQNNGQGNGQGNGQLEASPSLYYQGATAFRNNAWQHDFDPACKTGVSSVRGRRLYMEDECRMLTCMEANAPADHHHTGCKTAFWAIFDGHAGGRCSKALCQSLAPAVCRDVDFHTDIRAAIVKGFHKANAEFLKKADKYQMNDGSTAAAAFARDGKLWVANVGDSRVVLCAKGKAVALSIDHKPNRPEERRRINALGGKVVNCFGVARVNGVLAVARAFGNRNMRTVIRADPEIQERILLDGDDFLVLASDGLWDTMSNQEVADIVCRCADKMGLQSCAELLTATSIRKGSMDNTTALVVDLRGHRTSGLAPSSFALTYPGGYQMSYAHAVTTNSGGRAATASTTTRALAQAIKDGDTRREAMTPAHFIYPRPSTSSLVAGGNKANNVTVTLSASVGGVPTVTASNALDRPSTTSTAGFRNKL